MNLISKSSIIFIISSPLLIAYDLNIVISDYKKVPSSLEISVYNLDNSVKNQKKLFRKISLPITNEIQPLYYYTFSKLKKERKYFIEVFQDTNNNGSLDKFWGFIEKEPYAKTKRFNTTYGLKTEKTLNKYFFLSLQ